MRSQLSLSSIGCFFGQVFSRPKSLSILFVTLALAACGNEDITISSDLPKDSVQPSLKSVQAVNKCNYTNVVALDDTILINLTASESIMKPVVSVAGHSVIMSGQHNTWSGEFKLEEAALERIPSIVKFPALPRVFSDSSIRFEKISVS